MNFIFVKQLPNLLTLFRILLTPMFVYAVKTALINTDYYIFTLVVYIVICLTDIFDGKIARKLNVQSGLGERLDVIADVLFTSISVLFLTLNKLLPIWLLFLVIWKISEFFITSEKLNKNHLLVFDPLGKISGILLFILPIVTLFARDSRIIIAYVSLISIMLILSSLVRINKCINSLLSYPVVCDFIDSAL